MVEADRLPPSILDIYKVFEHIDIIDVLSIGIQQQPSYTVTIPILIGLDFGALGHLWSQSDVNTLWSGVFPPPDNASQLKRRTSSSAHAQAGGICLCPPTYAILPMHLASQLKRRTSSSANA
jgi:hypothetical protein